MIAATGMLLGITACALRSAAGVALVACLLLVTFALSALLTPASVSWGQLGLAVLGYNCGLGATFLVAVVFSGRRQSEV